MGRAAPDDHCRRGDPVNVTESRGNSNIDALHEADLTDRARCYLLGYLSVDVPAVVWTKALAAAVRFDEENHQ